MKKERKRRKKPEKEERSHSDRELVKMLWNYIVPFKRLFNILIVLLLINVSFSITAPLLFQRAMVIIRTSESVSAELKLILPPVGKKGDSFGVILSGQ